MSTWDRCSITNGTESKTYNLFKTVHNAFRTVLQGSVSTLKFISKNLYLVLPGGSLVLPVIVDNVFQIQPMPDCKVWAVRTEYYNFLTDTWVWGINIPLFKNSLEDIWRDVVEPFDTPLQGSEYFLFRDEDTGEIKQGYDYYGPGKHRYFMLLADGGPVVRDVTVIYLFVYLLSAIGAVKLIQSFLKIILMNVSDISMKYRVKDMYGDINNLMKRVDLMVGQVDGISTKVDELSTVVGLKLAFV